MFFKALVEPLKGLLGFAVSAVGALLIRAAVSLAGLWSLEKQDPPFPVLI